MRVIHIASFRGNVGDIINHTGFYKGLHRYLSEDIEYERIELRKFYRNANELHFDSELAEQINRYDLLVIGGGGFFDVRWNESATGTTLDLSPDFLNQIRVPVLINSMGFHVSGPEDSYEQAHSKFYHFLMDIKRRENWKVTFRNDGSCARLAKLYGEEILDGLETVPDQGFFFSEGERSRQSGSGVKTLGFSITNDLFDCEFTNHITEEDFNRAISKYIRAVLEEDYHIVLFAHTPQDLNTIHKIYVGLGEKYFREQIMIAPYRPGDQEGAIQMERYYQMCDGIVAMRFHGNILALQNQIPVIGLAGHTQIESLYKELDMEDYCIHLGGKAYLERLNDKLEVLLQFREEYRGIVEKRMMRLREERDRYMREIQVWIGRV